MKRTLESLIAASVIFVNGCATATTDLNSSFPVPPAQDGRSLDKEYDSVDDLLRPEDVRKLADANYMIISESVYKDSDGKEKIFHSIGTAVMYKNIGSRSYLATANHVVENEEVLISIFSGEFKKVSEQFYILEDDDVGMLHETLRALAESKKKQGITQEFYVEDKLGNKKDPSNYMVHTSSEMASILSVLKPKKIHTIAQNEEKDLAVVSVKKLRHAPLYYSIGNSNDLERQNLLLVVGFPDGLFKNVTRGYVTSVDDSKLANDDPKNSFIFDASISPGNSGGGIFAVRDGKLELVGITSATYRGANDLNVGVKINGISEVFKGNRIRCEEGWECNLSLPYELKL